MAQAWRVLNEWALRDPNGAMRLLMGKVTARELVAEKPDVWRAVCAAVVPSDGN